jgi:hypothetical protein
LEEGNNNMAAFVRKKTSRGGEYYQLVESHRVDGQPRQRVLVHLGRRSTVDDALREWPKEIDDLRRLAREGRLLGTSGRETGFSAAWARENMRRAASAEKRADELGENLRKLRELRRRGVA